MRKLIVGTTCLLFNGCVAELGGDPGYLWCVEATGANGTRQSTGGNVNFLYSGDWINGCKSLCPSQHTIMQQGEDGNFDSMHPLYSQWQSIRTAVFDRSALVCENYALFLASTGAIVYNQAGDLTCAAAVALQAPTLTDFSDIAMPEGYCDDIGSETGSVTTGDPTGGTTSVTSGADTTTGSDAVGPHIYGLTSYSQVLNCSTDSVAKKVSCNVDQEFIRFLVENARLVWSDEATLEQVTGGWKFDVCDSDSLMYALGFRENDTITEVGNSPVTGYIDAVEVFGQFGSTLFSGGSVAGKFYRGSALWTFVANRVNNPNYP